MSLFKKSGVASGNKSNPASNMVDVKYQCPMKCEGDKVYDQPGRCPVCKMELAPVKKNM
jgi:hypothetical protein